MIIFAEEKFSANIFSNGGGMAFDFHVSGRFTSRGAQYSNQL
jgi:hypothetical protein